MKAALIFALLLTACASGMQQSTDRRLIEEAELQGVPGQDAYELVQRLRPNWLVRRVTASQLTGESTVLVYMNDMRMGGAESLRDISRPMIKSIRLLTEPEVTALVGLDALHVERVIVVQTKTGG